MTEVDLLADARKLIAAGADQEMIVLFLRDKGLNKIASIRAIRALFANSNSAAKTLVDESKAWSDRFYSDLDLRDKARQVLLDLASSGDKTIPRVELSELDETGSQ